MTARTVRCCFWTNLCIGSNKPGARRVTSGVAGQTFRIIRFRLADDILMRIMTRDATDSRIRSVEAFAVRQPVGLEPDIDLATPFTPYHHLPAAVALPAKI